MAEFCPTCGTGRTGAFRFCRSCGLDFDASTAPAVPSAQAQPATPQPTPVRSLGMVTSTRNKLIGLWLVVVAVGLASANGDPTATAVWSFGLALLFSLVIWEHRTKRE